MHGGHGAGRMSAGANLKMLHPGAVSIEELVKVLHARDVGDSERRTTE
jgi:hypothetical protein